MILTSRSRYSPLHSPHTPRNLFFLVVKKETIHRPVFLPLSYSSLPHATLTHILHYRMPSSDILLPITAEMHPSPTPATQHRHYLKPLPLSLHTMNDPPCQSVDKILNQKLLISVDAGYIHTYKHLCLVIMVDRYHTIPYHTGRSLFDDGWDIHYIIRYVHDSVPVHSCAKTVIRHRTLVPFIKERKKAKMCDDTAPGGGTCNFVSQSAPWSIEREFHLNGQFGASKILAAAAAAGSGSVLSSYGFPYPSSSIHLSTMY